MKPFDPTKPARTKNGRPVRIICTDAAGFDPIIALVPLEGEHGKVARESPFVYKANGVFLADSPWNLENVPETKELWLSLYLTADESLTFHSFYDEESALGNQKWLTKCSYTALGVKHISVEV